MNIHINKHTRLQPWGGKTIFNEYPVHIRAGNLTVTLLFHDQESIENLHQVLTQTMDEIVPNTDELLEKFMDSPFNTIGKKRI